jgi:hypothetical protein
LVLLLAANASAQSYSIDWATIDGGGTSTGGVYSAIQTEGALLLTITRAGANVILSWPYPSTGFVLQENSALASTNWSNVGQIPADDGNKKSVTLPVSPDNKFFRLSKP